LQRRAKTAAPTRHAEVKRRRKRQRRRAIGALIATTLRATTWQATSFWHFGFRVLALGLCQHLHKIM
jgi:hypothetical protein